MPATRFDVLTIFPDMFDSVLAGSLLGKARARGVVTVNVHNLRNWAQGPHHITDDYAYGGGPGMVMKPEPIVEAVEHLRSSDSWVILLAPQGRPLTQPVVRELVARPHLMLICGRYEGVDERVRQLVVNDEISLGDYILSGGEIAAMALIDAVSRYIPGVLGSEESLDEESHAAGLLEYPQYTRPEVYQGLQVPEVLLSGHHARIRDWRRAQSLRRTMVRRPDLLGEDRLSVEDRNLLARTPVEPGGL